MNKKGFTLIELLAVIVILAVIALIATPIILGIIDDTKKGAFEESARNTVKSAERYYATSNLKTVDSEGVCYVFNYSSDVEEKTLLENEDTEDDHKYYQIPVSELNLSGSIPTDGFVIACVDNSEAELSNGAYTYILTNNGEENVLKGDLSVNGSKTYITYVIDGVETKLRYTVGDDAVNPEITVPTKENYTFVGYSLEPDGELLSEYKVTNAPATLYGVYVVTRLDIPLTTTYWDYTPYKYEGWVINTISINNNLYTYRAENASSGGWGWVMFNTKDTYPTSKYKYINITYKVQGRCTYNQGITIFSGELSYGSSMDLIHGADGCSNSGYTYTGTMQLDISSLTTDEIVTIQHGWSRANAPYQTWTNSVWLSAE